MALILISGYPSSGKTHRARQLVEDFEARAAALRSRSTQTEPIDSNANADTLAPSSSSTFSPPPTSSNAPSSTRKPRNLTIHCISDHSLRIARSSYATAAAEKTARATLMAAAKRAVGRDAIVILDSGNYIKGWRYQLHCEAKAMGVRSAVVHVGTPRDAARAINDTRLKRPASSDEHGSIETGGSAEQDPYSEQVWDELAMRFEEPNGMARWDRPLYVVAWEDKDPSCGRIWDEVVLGLQKDGTEAPAVRPNQATVLAPSSTPSHLHDLDRTTQDILSQIQQHQASHPDSPGGTMTVVPTQAASGGSTPSGVQPRLELELPHRLLTAPHLQRLRRQFIALHRQQMGGLGMGAVGKVNGGLDPARLAGLFVDWLGDVFEREA